MIFIASDHAGIELKNNLIKEFAHLKWTDLGPSTNDSVDYPDFANLVCQKINSSHPGEINFGILICGSGQGMNMRANKFKYIRAALCWNAEVAKLAREHNNANVLCLGARFIDTTLAKEIVSTFLNTPFAGGRHERRVNKLSEST